jgi:hypothetical protein
MILLTKNDEIEFILRSIPGALEYLMKKGVCGISCGEPYFGKLEIAAREKGFTESEIDLIVSDLNKLQTVSTETPTA